MISYEEFLANADVEDVRVLNLLSQGQSVQFNVPADADAFFDRIVRLNTAGFVLKASRTYENRVDGLWQVFSAYIDPVAAAYLARAASERITLSRLPLPA